MDPQTFDLALAAASLALFAVSFAGAVLATRPLRPRAAPATQELGDEPPAVVNLLANGWRLDEDAVEATLLDLAARRHLELRQPGDSASDTTVHLRPPQDAVPGALTRYEQQVLDRVRELAVGGVVPVTALTFRDTENATRWDRSFRRAVIADARARGLSRARVSGGVRWLLEAVAAVSSLGVGFAGGRWAERIAVEGVEEGSWLGVAVMVFCALSVVAHSVDGERLTAAGRAAAVRWLGVRNWLHGHEEFRTLPPASVTVWDRYLPYGAALGVTRLTSRILDFGLADTRRVWSSYGGRWRRVRVSYPSRGWGHPHYGWTSPQVLRSALSGVAGGAVALWLRAAILPVWGLPAIPALGLDATMAERLADAVLLLAGIVLLGRGGYLLLRAAVDIGATRTISGQVLWVGVWMRAKAGNHGTGKPSLHSLAVDDGASDRTTAWVLPPELLRTVVAGDVVTIRARPWTRRVLALRPQTGRVPGGHAAGGATR